MRKIAFTAFIVWAVSAVLLVVGCAPPEQEQDPSKMPSVADQQRQLEKMVAEFEQARKKAQGELEQARKELDDKLRSLCRGEAPLELIDAAHNEDFRRKMEQVFNGYSHRDAKYGPRHISATFTDIGEKEFGELIKRIRTEATDSKPQLVLALRSHPPKCVATPGKLDGASTAAKVVSTPRVLVKLEVTGLVGQPNVWIMPTENHWLKKVSVIKDRRIEIEGRLPLRGWKKTPTGWEAIIDGRLPLEVAHDKALGKFTDTDGARPLGTLLYVMAARKALGGVVQYRKFGVTDPVQSPPDEQINLKDATLHPACPPIADKSVAGSFKQELERFLNTRCKG